MNALSSSIAPLLPLSVGVVLAYVVFRRRYPRDPKPAPGTARWFYLKGTFSFILAAIFVIVAFFLYSVGDLMAQAYSIAPGTADIFILLFFSAVCIYKGKQYRGQARALNLTCFMSGPLVLYLRPFCQDSSLWRHAFSAAWEFNPFHQTFEDQLTLAVKPLGTLIAIGNPNEKLPTPGGLRIYERESDWQQAVSKLIQKAKAVIIQAVSTPGVLWELGECRKLNQPEHTVLLLHNLSKEEYNKFSMICFSQYNLALPAYNRKQARNGLILFDSDWNASIHNLKAPFWRCPIHMKFSAQLRHSLEYLFSVCQITWKPHPFAVGKLFILLIIIFVFVGPLLFNPKSY